MKLRLFGLWSLSLIASVAVGILLIQLYQQSTRAQVGHAEVVVARACDLIRDRYGFYTAGWQGAKVADDRLRTDLTTVVSLALAHQDSVKGGIWQTKAGSLAYAYPTTKAPPPPPVR